MIILLILLNKGLIGKIRYAFRITARYEAVAAVREEQSRHGLIRDRIDFRHCAFHLVEHNTFVSRFIACSINMPSFLIEDVRIFQNVRPEDTVQINIHQIEIILLYAARDRVNCFVRESHRVQEGIHGSLQKLHERLLDRVFIRTAEYRVLEDMEHAGAV